MTVTCHLDDEGVASIVLDDGARNVISFELLDELEAALQQASEARALVLAGREGALSAGLDLTYVRAHGAAGARDLILRLGEVALALWTDPRPTACAATGHALAGGTILAMTCDHVVAADGPFKWGLVETAVNLEVPDMALALAAQRLQARHVNQYVLPGSAVDVATAVAIGYADESAAPDRVVGRAVEVARARAELPAGAYAGNKRRLRGQSAARLREAAERDVTAVVQHLADATAAAEPTS